MAAPTLAEIRIGLKTNLSTIPGVQVSEYILGGPTPPYLEVFPEEITYDRTHRRGNDTWTMVVRAFVGTANDVGAQVQLDLLLAMTGVNSVKAAIESDTTLGGKVHDLQVKTASGYRIYQMPGRPEVLGCEWTVEVLAPGI